MTQAKPLDIEKFFQQRNGFASAHLTKSNMQAMDNVRKELVARRKEKAQAEQEKDAKKNK